MENPNANPLLCDLETGLCQLPSSAALEPAPAAMVRPKPVKVIYYTDPICSTCWGIEPQLRKLKLDYGHDLEITYRMGGLLPDWSYNSGGISKPADVARHWDEVSQYYDMPIDGDVWLEDPLPSSYPPSIAFKAAQLQSQEKALQFLRIIREMVFLHRKNITRPEHLSTAARAAGLDVDRLKTDMEGEARTLFSQDLELGRKLGVRGFPTLFFADDSGRQEIVYGYRPYEAYVSALLRLHDSVRRVFDTHWTNLFAVYPSLTAREFSELSGVSRMASERCLQELTEKGHLTRLQTKNGSLWTASLRGNPA